MSALTVAGDIPLVALGSIHWTYEIAQILVALREVLTDRSIKV
jgi:hypothetical protein